MGRIWLAAAMTALAFGCAPNVTQDEPPAVSRVDRILVDKSEHRMDVFRANQLLRTFSVALGAGGLGPKIAPKKPIAVSTPGSYKMYPDGRGTQGARARRA